MDGIRIIEVTGGTDSSPLWPIIVMLAIPMIVGILGPLFNLMNEKIKRKATKISIISVLIVAIIAISIYSSVYFIIHDKDEPVRFTVEVEDGADLDWFLNSCDIVSQDGNIYVVENPRGW